MARSRDLLARRRNRAIAIILGVKEREVDNYLPPAVNAKLRKVILDQLNDFFEFALDVAGDEENLGGDVVTNALYQQKIDEIHQVLVGS